MASVDLGQRARRGDGGLERGGEMGEGLDVHILSRRATWRPARRVGHDPGRRASVSVGVGAPCIRPEDP